MRGGGGEGHNGREEYWPGNDPKYAALDPASIPRTECLKDTVERFLPCWENVIAPAIRSGKRVCIAGEGWGESACDGCSARKLAARLGEAPRRH